MDLVSLGKEFLQNIVEHASSYRLGQSVLRQLDRGLWVVEKCARWAVPPPLDQDERPQPELVRPLPWVFFLMMLLALRVARETVSLIHLVMGKPPLRSADVVTFIQSKRRYLRALKYQGSRNIRARASTQHQPWYSALNSLFQLTMCFRRESQYGNNNNTRVTNNDEVVVIKRNKRGRQEEAAPAPTETTMERLIEKMMLDLDAESDEDSNYTLANATDDRSDLPESDLHNPPTTPTKPQNKEMSQTNGDDIHFSPNKIENSSSTPEKEQVVEAKEENPDVKQENKEVIEENNKVEEDNPEVKEESQKVEEDNPEVKEESRKVEEDNPDVNENQEENRKVNENHSAEKNVEGNDDQTANSEESVYTNTEDSLLKESEEKRKLNENITETGYYTGNSVLENSGSIDQNSSVITEQKSCEDASLPPTEDEKELSPKEETQKFIKNESRPQSSQKPSKKDHKIANGRTVKSVPSKKKGAQRERRDSNEVPQQRVLPSNNSF